MNGKEVGVITIQNGNKLIMRLGTKLGCKIKQMVNFGWISLQILSKNLKKSVFVPWGKAEINHK